MKYNLILGHMLHTALLSDFVFSFYASAVYSATISRGINVGLPQVALQPPLDHNCTLVSSNVTTWFNSHDES